jgi:hypothetical protein
MGRPPLANGRAKGVVFTLRLSHEELSEILSAATRSGQPVSRWAREVLLKTARI